MNGTWKDIEKLEKDLWAAADNLRANSKLTSNDYFMPVLGVIFLWHAANRFEAARQQIEEDQSSGKMPEFSMQKAHDNGEFFTPSAIVQTIVNVIEPDHGTGFDPPAARARAPVEGQRRATMNR
jgi:type I restriction-modification system DNA methylase subunit